MKRLLHSQRNAFKLITTLLFIFVGINAFASVGITTATGGTSISADKAANANSPVYTTLGNIVITEGAKTDFAASLSNATITLTPPSGWTFNPGVGTLAITGASGVDFTASSIVVSANSIVITYSTGNQNKFDTMTISGIQIRATDGANVSGSGDIVFSALSNAITGITAGTTVAGSLSQVVGAMTKLVVTLPGQTFTDGTTLAGSGNSGTVTTQTVGTSFNITQLTATDQFYNVITTYTGTKTIAYTGPGTSSGGSPTYTTTVSFTSGASTTALATSLRKAETVSITATNGGSFGTASSSLTVNPKALTITSPAVTSKTYDGTTTATITGTLSGILSGDTVTLVGTGIFSDKNVGTGKSVTSTSTTGGADAANYTITQPTGLTGTITIRALTITGASNSKTYDGATTSATAPTVTSGTVQSGDTAAFTQTYDTKNVGTSKVMTPSGVVTDGNSGNNYSYTFVTSSNGTITALALTVTGATTTNKVYDKANTASVTGGSLVGVISPDVVTLSQSGTFVSVNVGTAIAITSTSSISGADVGNYILTQPSLIARNITARVLTITGASNSKIYDGTTSTATVPTVTSGIIQSGDTAAFTQTYDTKNVGTSKVMTPTGVVTDGNSGNNYSYTFVTSSNGTITARALTVTGAANSKTYDGTTTSATTPTVTSGALQSGDTAAFTQTYDTKNVGTSKVMTPTGVVTDGNSGNNYSYTFVTSSNGTITTRSLTITGATNSKTYDGTTTSATIPTITSGIVQSGDLAAFTQTYDDKNIGSFKVMTPTGVVTDGNSGNNYSYTFVTSSNGTISTATLTITDITANNKTYDGLTTATLSGTAAYSGLQNSETFTVIGTPSASFATATIGTGKVVTVTGYTAPNSNYTVSQPAGLTADITKAVLTITVANQAVAYGTAVATITGAGTYTPTGFVNSETASVISGSASYTTTYTTITGAGTSGVTITPITTGLSATNYSFSPINGIITINKANSTIVVTGSTSYTYKGLTQGPTTSTVTGSTGAVIYSYSGTNATTYGPSTTPPINAGDYQVIATLAADANYNGSTSSALAFTITTASLTINGITGVTKSYDGLTTATLSGTASYVGLQNGETFTVTGTPSASFATATVGTGKTVTVTGYTAPSSNYTLTQPSLSADITPVNLTITGITANTKTYDGLTTATLSGTAIYSGLQNGETFTVTGTPSASFTTATAGMAKPVTVTGYNSPNTNYTLSQPTGLTANIIAADPTSATASVATICIGGNTSLSLNGGGGENGALVKWYSGSCGGTLVGTGNGLSVSPTTTTTYYGRYEGVLYTTNCASVTITVSPTSTVGAVSANQTICSGSSPSSDITIASATGTIQWQSADNAGFTTNLNNIGSNATTLTIAEIGTLTATKYFRAIVISGVCSAVTSETITVTVDPTSAVGAVSANQTICSGSNPASNITIASATGTIQWQSADNAGFTTNLTNIGTNTTTLTTAQVGALTATKYFRAVVTSGVCSAVTSGTVTVTVDSTSAVGAVSANQTICSGSSPSSNITIASATGTIQWQRANNAGFTTGIINIGTNATTLTTAQVGALTATKYFRAVVTSGVCSAITSGTITVTVDPTSAIGAVSANQTICSGSSPSSNITIASATGTIQWQSADNAGFTTNLTNIGTNTTTLTTAQVGALTATKYFRAVVTSGVCSAVTSGTVTVTVNAIPVSGTLSPTGVQTAVCAGTTVSATATAGSGGAGTIVDELEVSLSGGSYATYTSGASISTTGQTSVSIRTRRTATGSGCTISAYNTVSWVVNPLPTADSGADRTIFRGNSTILGTTAVPSNTYSWVSNPTGFTSSASNPSVSPLVTTTYTLTETTPQGCIKTNSVIVTVKDNLVISKSRISAAPTKPGDVVTYQISYQNLNNGGVAAQNITITDILPSTAYFTYTSSTPTGTYNSGSNTLTFSIASLAAGASGSITVSGTVGVLGGYGYDSSSYYISSGSGTQTISNSASIENAVTPTITIDSPISNTVTQYCGVSMPATLSGKVHTSTGSNVYYFIEVENTGNSTDRFTLSNTIPAQTGDVPLTSLITNMAGDAITQTPWLTPGQKYGFLVQFTTPGGTPPEKWNYTSIRATSTVCTTSATTYIETFVYNQTKSTDCDLLISKTAKSVITGANISSVIAGEYIIYTIVVRNLSSNKANDLVIDDILPANLTNITYSQTGADNITYTSSTRLIRVTRAGNYDNSNGNIVITITAQTTCSSVPSVTNNATVVNNNQDSNLSNNVSSVTVTVLPNVSDPAPISSIICSGTSTTLTLPSPGANRDYKWYNVATGGTFFQTGNTYNTGTLTSSTTYYVSQYNTLDSTCESNRIPMVVTVVSAPVVIAQPVDINNCGTTASFTYNVSGTFLTQQWQVSTDGGSTWGNLANTGVYSGVTNQTLNISNMAGLWGYKYRCVLNSYSCYTLTSIVASIVSLPTITGTLSVCSGLTTTLTGSGTPDATTPWTSSNQAVATVNSLGVVTGVSAGTSVITYKTSTNCTITATVTVNALPTITGTLIVCNGFSTTLTGSGTPDATTPWTSATTTVATVNSSGVVTSVSAGTSIITYKNSSGCTITATITVNSVPIITTQPITQLDCEGASVNFTAFATGTGLTYTWQRKKSTDLSFITIPVEGNISYPSTGVIKVDNVGSSQSLSGTLYQVVITNSSGCSVTSSTATLLVNEITGVTGGTNVTQCYGTGYSYTVSTSTPAPGYVVSYKWKSSIASGPWNDVVNGTHFSGATTATLNIINGTPAESAEYRVYITFHSSGADCNVSSTSRTRMITFLPLLTTPVTTVTQPTCNTATGTITVTVQSVSDTYSFDNGVTYQGINNNVKSGLTTGNYNVIIKNSQNCISPTTTATINSQPLTPVQPTLSVVTQPTCLVSTGTFTINNYNASYVYTVTPNIGVTVSGNTITAPAGSYSVIATLGACSSTASASVTITSLVTNTWTATGWSTGSAPTLNTLVVINTNYNTSTNGNLNACSVTINAGKKLTITANNYAIIQNDLTVNGELEVLDQGSLVMINDTGTVVNNGTTTVHRFTSPFEKFDYVYWSTPVASTNIPSTFPTWRTNYAFEFLPANFLDVNPVDGFDDNGDDWSYANTMSPGKGYIVMTPTNKAIYPSVEEIVFSGKVNNGVVTTPINLTPNAATDDDFNLVGNPYPSAISADAFINANINASTNTSSYKTIGGTLYFWTHIGDISNSNAGPDGLNFSTNDYAVYTLVGGVATSLGNIVNGIPQNSNKPTGYIASGQGFFVEADNAGTLLFNNAMRVGTETKNNQFYKLQSNNKKSTSISKDRIWLNLENSSRMFSQQLIGYFDNATLGYDKGYDGPFSDAGNYVNFYSFIDNDAYKIQGRSSFDQNDQVRLGYFSAVAGTFNINIDSKEGVFASTNQPVYLEDKVTNTLFDLKTGNYTFTTAKGTFNDRFVLRYTNDKTLGIGDMNKEDGILVFYSNNYKTLIIKNNVDSIVNSVSLFNMTGQNMTNWDVKDGGQTNIEIPLKYIPSGIYIVKVKTSKGESSKKIIVR